jgi:hypothetical protein
LKGPIRRYGPALEPHRIPGRGCVPTRRSRPWYPTITTSTGGVQAARAIADRALAESGPAGVTEMVVELTLKLAEAVERAAAAQGVTAADLANVWFVD